MTECNICSKRVAEVCGDGVCRDCHKSLTFEACCDGSWIKKFREALGEPPLVVG